MNLSGRAAIVTGGAGGVGGGIALELAREGARVYVLDYNGARAESVAREISSETQGHCEGMMCDVSVKDDVTTIVDRIGTDCGKIDILVNAAQAFGSKEEPVAGPQPSPVEAFPPDVWDYTFATGLMGTLYFCQAAFPYMKDNGGRVINLGSAWGQVGMAGAAAYNCNKEAIRALSRTMANEWGKYGINVNIINPVVETTSLQVLREREPEKVAAMIEAIPAGRLGTPRDAGRLAVFLSGDDSEYITGRTFMLDGGRNMFA